MDKKALILDKISIYRVHLYVNRNVPAGDGQGRGFWVQDFSWKLPVNSSSKSSSTSLKVELAAGSRGLCLFTFAPCTFYFSL